MIRRALWRLLLEEGGWSRIWYGLATAMVMVGGGLIYQQVIAGNGADAGTANLWIDQNGGNCVRSGSEVEYAGAGDTNSCASLDAAYQEASQGDYVNIVGGTYSGSATIDSTSKTCPGGASRVTYRVATGATVTFSANQLIIHSDCITVDGSAGTLNLNVSFKIENGAQYVTLAHADASGEQSNVFDASYVTITDVRMGNFTNGGYSGVGFDALYFARGGLGVGPSHVVVQDSVIGGIDVPSGAHPDCWSLTSSSYIIMRRNIMYDCEVQGFYPSADDARNDHLLVENNFFGDMTGGVSFNIGDSDNVVVRYNSFSISGNGGYNAGNSTNFEFYGNTGLYDCPPDTDYVGYNVLNGGTCGGTGDFNGNPGFVNDVSGPSPNLHLSLNTSPACARGKPGVAASGGDWDWANRGDFPATDYDGNARSSPPDAGADERADC